MPSACAPEGGDGPRRSTRGWRPTGTLVLVWRALPTLCGSLIKLRQKWTNKEGKHSGLGNHVNLDAVLQVQSTTCGIGEVMEHLLERRSHGPSHLPGADR